jgi:hypothetical protein
VRLSCIQYLPAPPPFQLHQPSSFPYQRRSISVAMYLEKSLGEERTSNQSIPKLGSTKSFRNFLRLCVFTIATILLSSILFLVSTSLGDVIPTKKRRNRMSSPSLLSLKTIYHLSRGFGNAPSRSLLRLVCLGSTVPHLFLNMSLCKDGTI